MVSVLTSSAVDRGFGPRLGQTKDYEIDICCFSAKHAALRKRSKDWLARNQNNVSEWSDMSIRGLLFQWASTIKIQLTMLVYNRADFIIISLKINLFSSWYSWKIAELALNNNHSLTLVENRWYNHFLSWSSHASCKTTTSLALHNKYSLCRTRLWDIQTINLFW